MTIAENAAGSGVADALSVAKTDSRVTSATTVTAFGILFAASGSHMLNDMMQALAPALYPVFREEYALTFFQTGVITLTFQITASLLQPLIGAALDRRPAPFALPTAMVFTLIGLVALAYSFSYPTLLASVALIGVGSAVFHPEASRAARAASGGRYGVAQSLFQTGGSFGSSLGPLMAALIVVPFGQHSVLAFTVLAFIAILLLTYIARWHQAHRAQRKAAPPRAAVASRGRVGFAMAILIVLVSSKMFYLASLQSYYTFYLIETFGVSVHASQVLLFVFLAAVAAGTYAGGPVGDRYGRKFVIWLSIVGVLHFTLALPYLGLVGTVIDSVMIGLVLSSAFSAIVVYAQELTPGNVGAVAGLFFGLAFGLGGIGAAALGFLADKTSLSFVYTVCGYLPAIGLLTYFLPDLRAKKA